MRRFIAIIAIFGATFCAIFATNAIAKPHDKPPHELRFAQPTPMQTELPRIKGIAPEIFANASEDAQRALQIEADMRDERHKATQKYRDERDRLELQKRILQVRLHHAKAKNDATGAQTLLNQIYENEQSLSLNRLSQRESRDKYEAQKIERIYNELRK